MKGPAAVLMVIELGLGSNMTEVMFLELSMLSMENSMAVVLAIKLDVESPLPVVFVIKLLNIELRMESLCVV